MPTDPWGDTSPYTQYTGKERDALGAAADKAMAEGWDQFLADQPLFDPEIGDLVEFVFSSMKPAEPPYGSAERALHDWASEANR